MLQTIVARKRQTVAQEKLQQPLDEILQELQAGTFSLSKVISAQRWSLIAECKLASPAKGELCGAYSVPELAAIYTANGASALSIHTDEHFRGRLTDIAAVRAVSKLPILRKEFIIDPYQIYQSRAAGADAILLIAAILSDTELSEYQAIAAEIGLDCLVEIHTSEELRRVLRTPARLIGINNRDLQTFTTDIQRTFELLPECTGDRIVISESGIRNEADSRRLQAVGVKGILVGEALVRAGDIAAKTRELAAVE